MLYFSDIIKWVKYIFMKFFGNQASLDFFKFYSLKLSVL